MQAFSLHRLYFSGLLFWWISIPFSMGLANVGLAFTSFISLLIIRKQPLSELKNLLQLPASVLFALCSLSIIWSDDKLFALSEIKTHLPIFLSAFSLFAGMCLDSSLIKKGFIGLIVSCGLAVSMTILFNILSYEEALKLHGFFGNLLQPFYKSDQSFFGWYVPFMVRTQFGNLLSLVGLTGLLIGILDRKTAWIIISLFFLAMVFVLGLRGSALGIVLALPFMIYLSLKHSVQQLFSLKTILVLSIAFIPVIYFASDSIKGRWHQTTFEWSAINNNSYTQYDYTHFTLLTRLVSWKNGLELWREQPLLGTGIGDYKREFSKTYENDSIEVPLYYHSQWLYFLDVFGSIGTFLLLSFILYWIRRFSMNPVSLLFACGIFVYFFIIWIFDAGMLSQTDMMSFGIFTTLVPWLQKTYK
jgi:O-antigen ligase